MSRRGSRSFVLGILTTASCLCFAATASGSHYIWRDGNKLHWEREGTAVAQVYFVDRTGPRWPVNAATAEWNQAADIGVYYRSPNDNCPFHCVGVDAFYYGTDEPRGSAIFSFDANGHLNGQGTYVRFNRSYADNEPKDRSVVCQELAHDFGLHHQGPDSTSCMTEAPDRFPEHPNDHDWNILSNLYDH